MTLQQAAQALDARPGLMLPAPTPDAAASDASPESSSPSYLPK